MYRPMSTLMAMPVSKAKQIVDGANPFAAQTVAATNSGTVIAMVEIYLIGTICTQVQLLNCLPLLRSSPVRLGGV